MEMEQRRTSLATKLKYMVPAAALITMTSAMRGLASVQDSLSKAGIKNQGDTSGLFADLQGVVYLIMALGGFWGVVWIIIGAMLLAGSGSNAQKRSGGIGALGVACVGLFVIYKAYDIAGWATGIGSGTGG